MVWKRTTLPLALAVSLALAAPFGVASAEPSGPVAHSAGGDPVPLNPAIVGVPIARTAESLDKAADAIDEGKGATAAGPLRASRRGLIRSYRGARYLITNMPPPPAEDARAAARTTQKFRKLARRVVRAARNGNQRGWIKAQASQDDAVGPVFADTPTAVFNVLTSQYTAATTAVGILPDTTGNLLNRVKTTLSTAVILRNRLVRVIHDAAPPAPPEDAQAAQDSDDVTTFDVLMPGLTVLIGDEIQQMQALAADTTAPAASRAVLGNIIAADTQVLSKLNTWWPPVVED
jgi:hypothetical protein